MLFFLLFALVVAANSVSRNIDWSKVSSDGLNEFEKSLMEGMRDCGLDNYEAHINGFVVLSTNMSFCCSCVVGARIYANGDNLVQNYQATVLGSHGWYLNDMVKMLIEALRQKYGQSRNLAQLAVGCSIKKQNVLVEALQDLIWLSDEVVCLTKDGEYPFDNSQPIVVRIPKLTYPHFKWQD